MQNCIIPIYIYIVMKLFYNIRFSVSLLFVLVSASISAQKKSIYVLSDLHVMASELLVKDGTAWQNYLENDRKMVDLSEPIFEALSTKIMSEKPDLVLITGDLTKDGEKLSHNYVSSKLKKWKEKGISTLVIPGNHDFGTDFSCSYNGNSTQPVEVLDANGYKELYEGIGYFDHNDIAQKGFTDFSYWQEPIDGLIVIGLDSHTGSVSSKDVDEACRRIRWARHDGYEIIVMIHHALIPHFYKQNVYMDDALVNNHEQIKEKLLSAGAHIVLTGHFHTSDIARDFNDDMSESILDISTGSPISYPCDYRILTFDPTTKDITVGTKSLTKLDGIDNFPSYAKQRSFTSNKKVASRYITQLVNEMAPSYSSLLPLFINKWSTALANAFILHSEGNEVYADANLKEDIRKDLSIPLSMSSDAGYMLTSLLGDISPYNPEGDNSHSNVTNDRDLDIAHNYLTIEMGAPSMEEIVRRYPEVPSAATLYYGDVNLVVPEGISVCTLKLGTNGALKTVEQSELYLEDEVIPAGTAVIVQSVLKPYDYYNGSSIDYEALLANSREYAIPSYNKCTFRMTDAGGAFDTENVLQGSDAASLTTGPNSGTSYKFYKLCWNKDGKSGEETLGFYFSERDGAAFTNSAHKAYLAVPADSAADTYCFDDLTGIHTLSKELQKDNSVYSVTGMKMDGKQIQKGIYIIRGKKTVVR